MKKVYLNAGDIFSLDLNIDVSIPRTLSFDKDEFEFCLKEFVRRFLSDPDLVNFDEESKL